MSKTEGFVVLDTESKASICDKINAEKENKASFGNTTRKKLVDISNLPQHGRVSTLDEGSPLMPNSTKEYIDQLKKENLALVKILAERNKLIEVTGIELQRMRANLQKMQQQNVQLAQSNSQMLADLNSGKDRLKALQHELGCNNGVLRAKKLEIEERLKSKKCEKFDDKVEFANSDAAEVTKGSSKVGKDGDKWGNTRRRPKSKSLGSRQVRSKDEIENKRPCVRRQSARFGPEEVKPFSDQLDTEGTKVSVCFPSTEDGPPRENDSTSASVSIQDEGREGKCAPRHEAGNKRPRVRRQSARFRPEEVKPPLDLLETDDNKVSACVPSIKDGLPRENGSASAGVSIQDEGRARNLGPRHEAGNKRPCMRRQSARFKSEEPKRSDDLFEIEDAKVTASVLNDGANVSTSMSLFLKKEDNEVNPAPGFEALEFRRSSLSRPSRQAAKKVQSYKEIPLNIKMRRSE